MSLGQVRTFVEESKARGIRWRQIVVAGGEPTCHPQFREIVHLLLAYRREFSPKTRVAVVSNGYSERARRLLAELPKEVRVNDSHKMSPVQPSFFTFQVAPTDVAEYRRLDFFNGCWETQECGLGVTPYGYYPCPVAGAIDRVFGFGLGRAVIPDDADGMKAELRKFCSLCGRFMLGACAPLDTQVTSPTWAAAYERARSLPPSLARLAEKD